MFLKEGLILIVDDMPLVAAALESYIRSGGFKNTVVFIDSRDAKAYLEGKKVDALVTDMDMPFIRGKELVQIAHSKGVQRIIVVSALIDEDMAKLLQELGVWMVKKPFKPKDILDAFC